ncbi:MAG TPA: DUF4097 family beta strand repeat-containing protein [Ktedonobacterales bacterium]|jgi:DUF4097 and DUF4098 domain-containing protein YvlB
MSNEQTYSSGGLTRLEIGRADGDLEILGWDEPHVRIVGLDDDEEDSNFQVGADGRMRLGTIKEDVTITVPRGASLHILSARSDVSVRGLQGPVRMDAVSGDAQIQEATTVWLGAVAGDLTIERCQGEVRLNTLSGDLTVRNVGELEVTGAINGDVHIHEVAGEVRIKNGSRGDVQVSRAGRVSIANMQGDCSVAQTSGVEIGNLGGDLSVQEVESVCEVGNMHGDARLRNCGGIATFGNLGGDLNAQDVRGGIAAGMVSGDVHLDTPLSKDATYAIRAAGDITLRLRGEIHARFVAQTGRGTIQTRLPLTIERGRRRHLVGAIGRAEATVTLQSEGGDISISAADPTQERAMNDDFVTDDGEETGSGFAHAGHAGHGFGINWSKHPGGFRFAAGFGPDDPDGPGDPRIRGGKGNFPFNWDDAQRAEYERRIREMSDRTAKAARRAAERASEYAERAAKRARETDWEAVGRDVRTSIEHAMGEMERLLEQFRSGTSAPRPPTPPNPPTPPTPPTPPFATARNKDEVDAQRRSILEQLRSGAISLEEAERQLSEL